MSDQATLTTMTGKFSSLEEWNALQDELTLWRGRTLRALQHLSNLTGRFKDLNELQAVLDDDEQRWTLLSEMGLTMHVTEAEKDWMVPLAHAESKSLGNWVGDVFREAAERKRSESGSAVQTPQEEKMFPIMDGPAIPWSVIAPFAAWAKHNHYQTLERLAERGGLSVCEVLPILHAADYCDYWLSRMKGQPTKTNPPREQLILELVALVKERSSGSAVQTPPTEKA